MNLIIKRKVCFYRRKDPYPIGAVGAIWVSKDRMSILEVTTFEDYSNARKRLISDPNNSSITEIQLLKFKNYTQYLNAKLYSFTFE